MSPPPFATSRPPDSFLRSYVTDGTDGLTGDEAPFLLGNFWLVDALAVQGEVDEQLQRTSAGRGQRADMFAEEFSTESRQLLGSISQAFTHLGSSSPR